MTNDDLRHTLTQAEQLHAAGHLQPAASLYRLVLQEHPQLAYTAYNLGLICLAQQNYREAEAAFRCSLQNEPGLLEARLNLAFALQEQGDLEAARAGYRSILHNHPACHEARFNLACLQLLQGDFAAGLPGYELRFATSDPVTIRHQTIPRWNGAFRPGLRLLIHAEQGYGDTIQMLRYLPLLTERGIDVMLEVPETLFDLCRQLPGITCILRGQQLPEVDAALPIMSLPLGFGTCLSTIPSNLPYLQPDPRLVKHYQQRLPDTTGLRVGLAWAGRLDLAVNRKRSILPELLLPLFEQERISFISLQSAQPTGFELNHKRLFDCSRELTDFHQTAALISCLDLVITIDSAVAHLAGALGIPTWLLLPAVPDWRWLLEHDDSPWYPAMRIFRQPTPGDWQPVISRCIAELADCCSPLIWVYRSGVDFDDTAVGERPTPLSDSTRWPQLGVRTAADPAAADWLLFPRYLETITEFQAVAGMWRFLEQLPWFQSREADHLLFSDHDCTAPYHSRAAWFRASIDPQRYDPTAFMIPYQVTVPEQYLHFEPSRIRHHLSFIGYLGLLRERVPLINGVIAEPRLVHDLDLTTRFHQHQTAEQQQTRQERYLRSSSESLCVLCPRGAGSSSIRFFETLALGRIAVIQEPMLLPFDDRIPYHRFVISIPSDATAQAGSIIYRWLVDHEAELMLRCHEARTAWERHLAPAMLDRGVARYLCRRRVADSVCKTSESPNRLQPPPVSNPRSAEQLLQAALAAGAAGTYSDAEQLLRDALQYDHRCYQAYLALADLLAREDRIAEATAQLYLASLLRPDDPSPYQQALPLLQRLGHHDNVAWCIRELERLTPQARHHAT